MRQVDVGVDEVRRDAVFKGVYATAKSVDGESQRNTQRIEVERRGEGEDRVKRVSSSIVVILNSKPLGAVLPRLFCSPYLSSFAPF